uniref:Uncharacterized protein n=1 Tax=Timema genevievae TaxID=629358 RepID=A0A7R9KA32_TIMGE|nr:unnamed protein product [Timema genevievae]
MKSGVELAPETIRSQDLLTDLHRMGYDVFDYGDITYPVVETAEVYHKMKNLQHIAACHEKVRTLDCLFISDFSGPLIHFIIPWQTRWCTTTNQESILDASKKILKPFLLFQIFPI